MDPNFGRNGEALNPDDFYTNTYSLWQNSRYYDMNNLSPQNYNSNQWSTKTEFKDEKPVEVKKDAKNRRIITRASLYEDPELFYVKNFQQTRAGIGYDWTTHNWMRASELSPDGPGTSAQGEPGNLAQYQRPNRLQEHFEKMLDQPLKISKAQNMMQKMGWQGGALGKSGSGIVEPIKPNTTYGVRKGFGQKRLPRVKKIKCIDNNKNIFTTNVLFFILEFVKDDTEAEVLFESCLWKEERKWIHNIVNDIINADDIVDCDTVTHMDLVQQIHERNCFVLATQSEGEGSDRQLCLYKESLPCMYLVQPADLKEELENDEDMETDTVAHKQPRKQVKDQSEKNQTVIERDKALSDGKKKETDENKHTDEMEIETNPFMRSITRNLTNDDQNLSDKLEICSLEEGTAAYRKIIEYFLEFAEDDTFTEFRFLGPFTEDDIEEINKFLDNIGKCVSGDFSGVSDGLAAVLRDGSFDIREDVNGFAVIYKT